MTYLNRGRISRCRKCQKWVPNKWPHKSTHDKWHALAAECARRTRAR